MTLMSVDIERALGVESGPVEGVVAVAVFPPSFGVPVGLALVNPSGELDVIGWSEADWPEEGPAFDDVGP